MNTITWMQRQVFKVIAVSALITLVGGIFLSPPVYADTAAVWTLNSSGAYVSGKSYTATGFLAQGYHVNSDGTAILLWTRTGRAAVWYLNSSGAYTGGTSYAADGFAAQSYHRNSDGTATLLWTRSGKAAVWYLNSSGAYTGGKVYSTGSEWLATSYVRYSDGTATLLWTKPDTAAIWFLNSSGAYVSGKSYTATGWNAKDYIRNSDGTATLLWGIYGKAAVWYLNSSGAYTGGKTYTATSFAATSYMSSNASAAMKSAEEEAVITVRKMGNGAGTIVAGDQVCDAACQELTVPYVTGEQVDLQVTPATGSSFAGWQTADGVALENIYYANPGDTVYAIFNQQ